MLDFGYYNMDCIDGMKQFPDKYFDLAIVDPPYGDASTHTHREQRFGGRFDKYKRPPECWTDRRKYKLWKKLPRLKRQAIRQAAWWKSA